MLVLLYKYILHTKGERLYCSCSGVVPLKVKVIFRFYRKSAMFLHLYQLTRTYLGLITFCVHSPMYSSYLYGNHHWFSDKTKYFPMVFDFSRCYWRFGRIFWTSISVKSNSESSRALSMYLSYLLGVIESFRMVFM